MKCSKTNLGDLVEITSGFAFKSNLFNESKKGLPLIRIRDVLPGFSETYYDGEYEEKYLINNGDALIGMDGNFNLAIWNGGKSLLNQRVCKIKSNNEKLDQRYLLNFLPITLKKIEDATPFVTVKHLSVKDIREIVIPLPPIEEQRRIAAILDKAEALKAKRREAIAKLDQLLQSVFFEIFGDPVKNEKKWQKNNILEYCDFLTGYPFKSANFVERNSGIKICRGANVLPGYIDWSDEVNYPSECFEELNNFQLLDGDVIVAMDRPWISSGFKAVLLRGVNEKILLVQRVARLRAKKKHYSSFIYKLICSQAFIQQCKPTETTIPHISPNDFRNFNIISPPEELIKKFHEFSEKIYSMKQKNEKSLKKLDHFAASLQDNFFN